MVKDSTNAARCADVVRENVKKANDLRLEGGKLLVDFAKAEQSAGISRRGMMESMSLIFLSSEGKKALEDAVEAIPNPVVL